MSFRAVSVSFASLVLLVSAAGTGAQQAPPNPVVVIETSLGDIRAELFKDRAPATVVNFLMYAQAGYYDNTIFHRVIRGFMIQGGGFTENLELKGEGLRGPIINEANNNVQNRRGTLAMARVAEPNSARSQFFINTEDNASLNYRNGTAEGFGYCVFGRVVDGMNVVEKIERVRTQRMNDMDDVPREAVIIKTVRQVS